MKRERVQAEFAGMPPVNSSGGKTAGVVVATLVVAAIAALSVVLFTGVIRFGTPKISGVTTARKVDTKTGKALDSTERFQYRDERIYCCGHARAFEDTLMEARWYLEGDLVGNYKGKYSELTGASTSKFLTTGSNVWFFLDRPDGGWESGKYQVKLLLSGKEAANVSFTIVGETSGQAGMDMSLYRDPSGIFSIRYPQGWKEADISGSKGALAGFIDPGDDQYPPRLVVLETDFDSASVDYLNGLLESAGTSPDEMFISYSLGESQGARRTFQWDYDDGQTVVPLKSIQVLIQGQEMVYCLNCHCQASRFEDNLQTFNQIINSFRVND